MARLEDVVSNLDKGVKERMATTEQPQENIESPQEAESSLNENEVSQQEVVNQEAQSEAAESQSEPTVVALDEGGNSGSLSIVNEQPQSVDESAVLQYLSDKFGKEINSLDDLTASQRRTLSPNVESFLKWHEATGYDDPNLWYRTQSIDYNTLDDKDVIIEDYIINKGLTQEQAEVYYEKHFGEEAIDEDMLDEAEIQKLRKFNRAAQVERQLAAKESRQRFNELKQRFATPKEGYDPNAKGGNQGQQSALNEQAKQFWQENATKVSESLKEFVIPIGDNKGYRMSFSDYVKQNSDQINDVQKFFGKFIDKKTNAWDVDKLIKAAAFYENRDTIAKSIYKQGLSDGSKQVVTSGKNLNFDSTERSTPDAQKLSRLEEKVNRDKNAVLQQLRGKRPIF